jgi:hypothetical protein
MTRLQTKRRVDGIAQRLNHSNAFDAQRPADFQYGAGAPKAGEAITSRRSPG